MLKNWKIYALWIAVAEAVGALSGWLTRQGVRIYEQTVTQPPLSPPPWVFPVVWGILFALMGFGAARIYLSPVGSDRTRGLRLYWIQLGFNFLWSIIFFNLQAYAFALVWLVALWALILGMFLAFRRVDSLAGWLQLPYLLWVTFAAYLTAGVWILNR